MRKKLSENVLFFLEDVPFFPSEKAHSSSILETDDEKVQRERTTIE